MSEPNTSPPRRKMQLLAREPVNKGALIGRAKVLLSNGLERPAVHVRHRTYDHFGRVTGNRLDGPTGEVAIVAPEARLSLHRRAGQAFASIGNKTKRTGANKSRSAIASFPKCALRRVGRASEGTCEAWRTAPETTAYQIGGRNGLDVVV
jgi:hypothetical protein